LYIFLGSKKWFDLDVFGLSNLSFGIDILVLFCMKNILADFQNDWVNFLESFGHPGPANK
jgi:hypothetical protein